MRSQYPSEYAVDFGRRIGEGQGMEVLVSYVLSGFVIGETSRYDQAMGAIAELTLPDGVDRGDIDWLEIKRLSSEKAAELITGLQRVIEDSGLVAKLIEENRDEPASDLRLASGTHGPNPSFARSIFEPADA